MDRVRGRAAEELRTAAPAVVSALHTAGVLSADRAEAPSGPGEVAVLLSLLFVAVRHCPWPWALVCGVLDAVAVLLLPMRHYRSLQGEVPASMRRTVGVLRDSGPAFADRRPVGDLAAVADLSKALRARFGEPSCTATRPCPTTCRTRCRRLPSGSCKR
ncbi:hypothetical protein [Streptomyces afghaniensis]|uniref:hypothetical protein n=1 Tax=Streptomyces afghaniensis TaxID=66865 RepID=UPI0037AC4C09